MTQRTDNRWKRRPDISAVDAANVESLRRHWEDGWNGEDVEAIVAPFHRDIVFSSPFVSRFSGDQNQTTLAGLEAVRTYCANSFKRATRGIRYTVEAVYAGTNSAIIHYTVHHPVLGERHGADSMRLDADGKVLEWHCHYDFES